MILTVLGSSSRGNCYILQNDTEALILEAGVKFTEVKKALAFNLSKVQGMIITHEHGDHAKYVNEANAACITIGASQGTIDKLKLRNSGRLPRVLQPLVVHNFGNFRVIPFNVHHDCAEPFGYLINHPETGTVLFATDTAHLDRKFEGLNNILIECNHSQEMLTQNVNAGVIPLFVARRTQRSHLSYDSCLAVLNENDIRQVNNIVLIHLSSGNSDPELFKTGVHAATGKNVVIAQKWLSMNFNKEPF